MIATRILVGLIIVLISIVSIVIVGINEPDRQAEFTAAFAGRSIEAGAIVFREGCSECHGDYGEGGPRAPALNSRDFFDNRITDLDFPGTMEAYLELTIAGGRPAQSAGSWPQNMPTWSVDFGGPLRNDQIKNVVDYIMNWEEEAPDRDADAPVLAEGDTPEERGASLFQAMACGGCHIVNGEGGAVGPDLTNVYAEQGEDYVRESILDPEAAIAEGFVAGLMPATFGDTLSTENIDDLVAFLASVSQ